VAKLSRTPIPTVELFRYPVQKKTVDTGSIFKLYFLISYCTSDSRTWKDSRINNNDTGNIFKTSIIKSSITKKLKINVLLQKLEIGWVPVKEFQIKHWIKQMWLGRLKSSKSGLVAKTEFSLSLNFAELLALGMKRLNHCTVSLDHWITVSLNHCTLSLNHCTLSPHFITALRHRTALYHKITKSLHFITKSQNHCTLSQNHGTFSLFWNCWAKFLGYAIFFWFLYKRIVFTDQQLLHGSQPTWNIHWQNGLAPVALHCITKSLHFITKSQNHCTLPQNHGTFSLFETVEQNSQAMQYFGQLLGWFCCSCMCICICMCMYMYMYICMYMYVHAPQR